MNMSPGDESERFAELLSAQYPKVKDAWREDGTESSMEVTWDPFAKKRLFSMFLSFYFYNILDL